MRREIEMAHRVGIIAARLVDQIPWEEEGKLEDSVFEILWSEYDPAIVERDTDRTRVRDAIRAALGE